MSKLHWAAKDVFGLPGMPDWAVYATIDKDGGMWIWDKKPKSYVYQWFTDDGLNENLVLETDYTGDWRDSFLERPQEIKVGDFCKVWDGPEPEDFRGKYCYISRIDDKSEMFRYVTSDGGKYYSSRKFNPPTRID